MYLTKEQEKMYMDNEGLIYFAYTQYIKKLIGVKHLNTADIEDVIQAGSIGLMKACKTFDPNRNIKFSTYAMRLIHDEMHLEMRNLEKYKHNSVSLDSQLKLDTKSSDQDIINPLFMRDIAATNAYEDVETKVINRIILDRINYMRDPWQTIAKMIMAGYTYEEIGKKLGCTKERIGQRVIEIRKFLEADTNNIKKTAHNICASRPQM